MSATCRQEGFIGANFDIQEDLTNSLCDDVKKFNEKYIPVYMSNCPDKSKTAAGLSCGFLWTVCKGLEIGDVVLSPNGAGCYYVGEIVSDYYYVPGEKLPHRRRVNWYNKMIARKDMSDDLRHSSGAIGTCCNLTKYSEEINKLLIEAKDVASMPTQETVHVAKNDFLERSLHKLLCSYVRNKEHIFAKTIFHEKSSSAKDKEQKWVHPDIIGVSFGDYNCESTLSLLKALEPKGAIRLYSYEMKRRIENDYELKQYFFQALSNSNWANYGYLVAYEINEGLKNEITRLSNAFGIGVIQLQAKDEDTIVWCEAREKELDYDTIDKLCNINADFNTFISKLTKVMKASKDYAADAKAGFVKFCDEVFRNDDELENYCKENNIPF